MRLALTVNGQATSLDVEPRMHLIDALREKLDLTGSHVGCEHGVCGACTIRLDGVAVRGCLVLAVQAEGCDVQTVEGMAEDARFDALRAAFVAHNALQCGYCTPGMLAAAAELVEAGGTPDRAAIRAHISGNYCRCTGYQAVVDAIADVMEGAA